MSAEFDKTIVSFISCPSSYLPINTDERLNIR